MLVSEVLQSSLPVLHYTDTVEDAIELLQQNNMEQANIFGYSMGGYVGMYLAKHHPGKNNRLITLATKGFPDLIKLNILLLQIKYHS